MLSLFTTSSLYIILSSPSSHSPFLLVRYSAPFYIPWMLICSSIRIPSVGLSTTHHSCSTSSLRSLSSSLAISSLLRTFPVISLVRIMLWESYDIKQQTQKTRWEGPPSRSRRRVSIPLFLVLDTPPTSPTHSSPLLPDTSSLNPVNTTTTASLF